MWSFYKWKPKLSCLFKPYPSMALTIEAVFPVSFGVENRC